MPLAHYSRPFQQYVHSLHLSIPTESSMSSKRLNLNDVKFCSLRISSTICSYLGDSGSAYSFKTSSVTLPFSKRSITLLAIKSISDVEREKFRYLHPYNKGGHAGLTWTSLAPLSYKNSVVSRSCVPLTIESSINSRLLSRISSSTAKSFILAIKSLLLCIVGIKERGQVGVYLIKGLENGIPDSFA